MKRVCTICARGGSRGVPNKNIRVIAGRPLIAHSVVQAKLSGLFQVIAVSSDSQEIRDCGREAGADMLIERPPDMATDVAAKVPAIVHCATTAEQMSGTRFDVVVDLDATAPLRSVEDIRGAVALLEKSDADNVITGARARRSPYFNMVERRDDGRVSLSKALSKPIVRRQDAPQCFDMNASIYVWRRDYLLEQAGATIGANTLLFEMPEERSIDIDSELDFRIVQLLLAERS
jgi:N-acylneuraminate cytidylyltransferase/CMP-N,N'-diacetyllegionaminic acid synthase